MPLILIKNNLKLMFRSKWILFMMIILPVVTIALLSNAFKGMMNISYSIDDFNVGYRISEGDANKNVMPSLQTICKDEGITLSEYPEGDITKLLQAEAVDVFIEFKDDHNFTIYRSNEKEAQAGIVESIFSGFFYQVNEANDLMTIGGQEAGTVPEQFTGKVKSEVLATDPVPSSTDYYGIIYIVYFAWCGMVSLVAVISSERKSAIQKRMQATHMPKISYYLGKFIPCSLAIFLEICSAWLLSVILFDIHWGKPGLSVIILLLISLAASTLGMILFQLFNSVAVSIVIGFIFTWVMGFFGGSFEAYRYLTLPKLFINSSPLYYINRTLVEYSTMGHSAYTGKCFLYLSVMIIVCGVIGIILMNRRMEEQ
jgi:ABC-2 type transport system permease protein